MRRSILVDPIASRHLRLVRQGSVIYWSGMGIGIVLFVWAVLGFVAALAGAAISGLIAALLTRRAAGPARRRVILLAGLFPFACLGWVGAVLAVQAIISETFLGRDVGIGDCWHCRLVNGCQLQMIDTTDRASIQSPAGVCLVSGVRTMQVAGDHLLASLFDDQHSPATNRAQADSYCIVDTRTGGRVSFSNRDRFEAEAKRMGIALRLEPVHAVYCRYAASWIDVAMLAVLTIVPAGTGLLLVGRVIQVRRM